MPLRVVTSLSNRPFDLPPTDDAMLVAVAGEMIHFQSMPSARSADVMLIETPEGAGDARTDGDGAYECTHPGVHTFRVHAEARHALRVRVVVVLPETLSHPTLCEPERIVHWGGYIPDPSPLAPERVRSILLRFAREQADGFHDLRAIFDGLTPANACPLSPQGENVDWRRYS